MANQKKTDAETTTNNYISIVLCYKQKVPQRFNIHVGSKFITTKLQMNSFAGMIERENGNNSWKGNNTDGKLLSEKMVNQENERNCWKHKKGNDSTACFDHARALMDDINYNNQELQSDNISQPGGYNYNYNHNENFDSNPTQPNTNNNNYTNNNYNSATVANDADDTTSMATQAMRKVQQSHTRKESINIAFKSVLANWEITDENMIDDLTTTALRELESELENEKKKNSTKNNINNNNNYKNGMYVQHVSNLSINDTGVDPKRKALENRVLELEKEILKLQNENARLNSSKNQWQKNFDEANYMIEEQSQQLQYLEKQNEYLLQSKNQSVLHANKTIDEMRYLLTKAMSQNINKKKKK